MLVMSLSALGLWAMLGYDEAAGASAHGLL
jgi:hypothetical protein